MAIEKFIIDKSDLPALLKGEDIAIQPKRNIKGFCVEIAGNLTNGDVIKAVFRTEDIFENFMTQTITVTMNDSRKTFSRDWWYAPYKAESEGTK